MEQMRETGTAIANCSAAVEEAQGGRRLSIPWTVTRVDALPDYELYVEFVDGTRGRVKMRDFIFSERAGVFTALRDTAEFRQISCDEGHVEWANGLDLAPDAMHDRLIAQNGEYEVKPYVG
jgi:hypothetical protein